MEIYQGAFLIIAVLAIVMLIMAVKTNSMLILNFVLRSVTGSLLIFAANYLLEFTGFSVSVGLNPGTVLTSGILGFPGVILLFGIKIYGLLWKSNKLNIFSKVLWTNKKIGYILTSQIKNLKAVITQLHFRNF